MHGHNFVTCMILVLVTATCPAQAGGADGTIEQQITLTGRVAGVYTSEKPLTQKPPTSLMAVEITVISVTSTAPTDVTSGQRVFIKIANPVRSADGVELFPDRGDIIEFHLKGRAGVFDVTPAGYRIVVPGKYQSESIGLRMALIPAGEFQMGSPPTEKNRRPDEFLHRVTITKPFYIGIHEVTQFEYHQVMQAKPSAFAPGGSAWDKVSRTITDQFPVENVSWFDAVRFCNRLSEKDGLTPYYKITAADAAADAAGSTPKFIATIAGGNGYRLPTEAEWEYACRAGSDTPFHFGIEPTITSGNMKAPMVAAGYGLAPKWRELGRTAKVGSYPPNDWGLFDMHGNVAEWCADWYDKDYYAMSVSTDPTGPNLGIHRVLRGGSGMAPDGHCRSAARSFHVPQEVKYFSGFRVARHP